MLILKLSLQTAVIIETANKDEEGIRAANIILTIISSVTLVLYTRNPTAVYKSICRRNKRQKRLDLGLGTLIDFIAKPATPATSINALVEPIYSIQPKSKVTIQVRMNQVILLRLFQRIQVKKKKSNTPNNTLIPIL